jgi:hypothetical protein
MVTEMLTLVGNLPNACGVCSFVQSMGKKLCKCMGIFVIDAMVILPFEKNTFLVKLP